MLADRIQNEVASLIAATCNADGEEQIAWLGGVTISRTAVLGHLLLELLVHGFDIAKTQRRPWPVPAAQARVIFDRFFVVAESGCRYVEGTFDDLLAHLARERDDGERRYLGEVQ